jgi:hypothetical protein
MRIWESKIRVALAIATPPLLLGMALLTLAVDSPIAVPIVFGALGTILGLLVLFDFPLAIESGANDLTRVCLLRHHRIPYQEINVIIKPRRRGLILIKNDRKRYVLVDRILEGSERNHLTDLGEQHGFLVEI